MKKMEEITDPSSCINKAENDEPVFVLRANDPLAAVMVDHWANQAEGTRMHEDWKIKEAHQLAQEMRRWRAHQFSAGDAKMESGKKEGLNGDETFATGAFGLSEQEKEFIFELHQRHIKCQLNECVAHSSVHLVVRLEAGLREARWSRVHGSACQPENCRDYRHSWGLMEWVREVIKNLEAK